MEINPQDVKAFLSERPIGRDDAFGKTFLGHIPANNSYGLAEMDVAIRVSHPRQGDLKENLQMQYKNELQLCSLRQRNIISFIGFSETSENFYLVYEMVQARPLAEHIEGLTWEQALKVLKGIASGLAFLHSHPEGPFVHSNICIGNILVTKDFMPKLVDFRYCVVEGKQTSYDNPRYYPSKKEGVANVKEDIFAFGLVALQLITKDSRTVYAVEEGHDISLHHILDLYVPLFKEKGNLLHTSYGQKKESRKITEMIFNCLKKDSELDLKTFHRDLVLLSLAKQC
ncbi:wall-associated receptor kinase 5-like [Amaranthus tricolor]|uniref:wall-associated receptor kinase 5-like n=1 Tax=Amaranthus tricolor TaxID=29722 RepID=UPI002588FD47|nr:wall-associated receptor kinase 5-like [Amaranthus tricolor]